MRIYLNVDGQIRPAVRCDRPGCDNVRVLPDQPRGGEKWCSTRCCQWAYDQRNPGRRQRPGPRQRRKRTQPAGAPETSIHGLRGCQEPPLPLTGVPTPPQT